MLVISVTSTRVPVCREPWCCGSVCCRSASQSISLSKLAGLMDMDVTSLRSQLMLLKQVRAASGQSLSNFDPDTAQWLLETNYFRLF